MEDILTEFDLYEFDEEDKEESHDDSDVDPDYVDPKKKAGKEAERCEVELDPVSDAGCSGEQRDSGLAGDCSGGRTDGGLAGGIRGERAGGHKRKRGGRKVKDGHFAVTVMPPENNLESDVEDNLVEIDEMRFFEGNVMETNSDNEREEYREELMVTVVPMSEVQQKVTDEDSDDLDDPSGLSKHLP